jgi:hypothetical protein
MLKPVTGGRKKIIITKKDRGFVASGQWSENSLPQSNLTNLTYSIDQPRSSGLATYTISSGHLLSGDQHKRVFSGFLSRARSSPNFVHRYHAADPKSHPLLALHGRPGVDSPRPKGSVRRASIYPRKGCHMLSTCPIPIGGAFERIREKINFTPRKSAVGGRSKWYRDDDAHHEALHGHARR